MSALRRVLALLSGLLACCGPAVAQYPATFEITKDATAVLLSDWAFVPISSRTPNNFNYATYPPPLVYTNEQLGRLNFIRTEPADAPLAAGRFFVCDMNRNLYIVNRTNQSFAVYLDFEATFPKFDNNPGFAGGLVTLLFHPGYASNGLFYTIHTDNPNKGSVGEPSNPNAALPSGYTNTPVDPPPVAASVSRHGVLVEWRDTNINNATFEGTARELLRVGFTGTIHPMGDLAFNPLVQPGDWDYGNLYIANGDGGAGETTGGLHTIPQRLDALAGKILRITPGVNLRPADLLAANGTYRIPSTGPSPNPFTATNASLTNLAAARPEVFAYGFRNPHRLCWDAATDTLLVNDIGLHSWEEVNIVHRGANYGYAEREGIENLVVTSGGLTGSQVGVPFPTNADVLTVTGLAAPAVPVYPVANYSHRDGDAISSGFVYRGQLLPQLRGKYIFAEIVNARLFYCDLDELLAADDGVRTTLVPIREIQVVHDNPLDAPDAGPQPRRLWDVMATTWTNRGGFSSTTPKQRLPGSAASTTGTDPDGVAYGRGRADIRIAQDADGELFVLGKSDGSIRKLTAALSPPLLSVTASNGTAHLSWTAVPGRNYRVQFKSSLTNAAWENLPGDVPASGIAAAKADAIGGQRYYRVVESPAP